MILIITNLAGQHCFALNFSEHYYGSRSNTKDSTECFIPFPRIFSRLHNTRLRLVFPTRFSVVWNPINSSCLIYYVIGLRRVTLSSSLKF